MNKKLLLPEETIADLLASFDSGEDYEKLRNLLIKHLSEEEQADFKAIERGEKTPSLMSDIIAKKIFDPDAHSDRMNYLLREITGEDDVYVDSSNRNEGYIMASNSKKVVFDINTKLQDKRNVDLEFQISAQNHFLKRGEIYGSDLLLLQYSVEEGQKKKEVDYSDIKGVIIIFLMKHSPKEFKECKSERYIHRFTENKSDSGLVFPSLTQYIYVQLDKCFEQFKLGTDGENNKKLQLLLSMLADANDEDVRKEIIGNKMFEDIISEANGMVAERRVLNMILAEKYAIADLNAVKNYERAEGKAEGKAEGLIEGQILATIKTELKYQDSKKEVIEIVASEFNISKEDVEAKINEMYNK